MAQRQRVVPLCPVQSAYSRLYALRRNEQPEGLVCEKKIIGKIHTDSKTGLTTGRLAENLSAAATEDNRLGVREHGRDGEAPRALDVHEEGVGALNQTLELVAVLLLLVRWVNEIDSEGLCMLVVSVLRRHRRAIPHTIF